MASRSGKRVKMTAQRHLSTECPEVQFARREATNPQHYLATDECDRFMFLNPLKFDSFHRKFKKAGTVECRSLVLKDFQAYGIPELIKFQKWSPLFDIRTEFNADIIKLFYANLTFEPSDLASEKLELSSYLFGQEINWDVESVCNMLGIPNRGLCEFNLGRKPVTQCWRETEILSGSDQWKILLGDSNVDRKEFRISHMDDTRKVLFHIVTRILVPRPGNFGEVTHNDRYVISHLLAKRRLNFGHLLLSHIGKQWELNLERQVIASLPYAHFIWHMLVSSGISLPAAAPLSPISHVYTLKTFRKRHLGGSAGASSSRPAASNPVEEQVHVQHEEPEQVTLQGLQTFMTQQFEALSDRIEEISFVHDQQYRSLDRRMQRMESSLTAYFTSIGFPPQQDLPSSSPSQDP